MVSPNPSSESSYVVRMDDDEYTPTPGVEVQGMLSVRVLNRKKYLTAQYPLLEQQDFNTYDLGDGDFKLWVRPTSNVVGLCREA